MSAVSQPSGHRVAPGIGGQPGAELPFGRGAVATLFFGRTMDAGDSREMANRLAVVVSAIYETIAGFAKPVPNSLAQADRDNTEVGRSGVPWVRLRRRRTSRSWPSPRGRSSPPSRHFAATS
jgi:hypothetical protein